MSPGSKTLWSKSTGNVQSSNKIECASLPGIELRINSMTHTHTTDNNRQHLAPGGVKKWSNTQSCTGSRLDNIKRRSFNAEDLWWGGLRSISPRTSWYSCHPWHAADPIKQSSAQHLTFLSYKPLSNIQLGYSLQAPSRQPFWPYMFRHALSCCCFVLRCLSCLVFSVFFPGILLGLSIDVCKNTYTHNYTYLFPPSFCSR